MRKHTASNIIKNWAVTIGTQFDEKDCLLKNISPLGVHTVSQDPPLGRPILLQQHLLPREQGISLPGNPSACIQKKKGRKREKAGGEREEGEGRRGEREGRRQEGGERRDEGGGREGKKEEREGRR